LFLGPRLLCLQVLLSVVPLPVRKKVGEMEKGRDSECKRGREERGRGGKKERERKRHEARERSSNL